jgi:hypothetical protein
VARKVVFRVCRFRVRFARAKGKSRQESNPTDIGPHVNTWPDAGTPPPFRSDRHSPPSQTAGSFNLEKIQKMIEAGASGK